MRCLCAHVAGLLLIGTLAAGCGFSPGTASELTGGTGNSGEGGVGATGKGGNGTTSGSGGFGLTGGGTGGGGGDIFNGTGGSCGQTNVSVTPEPPDILIVQDKSSSMNDDDSDSSCKNGCGANSKWSQVSAALTQVVTATQSTINWGLKFFSDNGACDASSPPVVDVAPMNGTAVSNAIAATSPSGNTPTRDAITNGATYLAGLSDANPKYLLLATDGLPNCPVGCASMSKPSSSCTMTDNPNEDVAAAQAIAAAAAMGYKTFVIGIGNVSSAVTTLNNMATSGGEPQTGAATSYYAATDPAALESALNAIVGLVASCKIPLTNVPANLSNVAVSADDSTGKPVKISEDPANGWSYTDTTMTTIQLNGTACTNLQNGSYTNFQFVYACSGTTICIDRNPDGTCAD